MELTNKADPTKVEDPPVLEEEELRTELAEISFMLFGEICRCNHATSRILGQPLCSDFGQ